MAKNTAAAAAVQSGWQESANVAGVSVEGGSVNIPRGIYKCKTSSVSRDKAKNGSGNNVLTFKCTVLQPKAQAGTVLNPRVTLLENNKFVLKRALLSHGVPAAALEKGEIKYGEATFTAKPHCFISFTPAPEGEKYYTAEFCTEDVWAASQQSKPRGAGATATGVQTDAADEADAEDSSTGADEADDLL